MAALLLGTILSTTASAETERTGLVLNDGSVIDSLSKDMNDNEVLETVANETILGGAVFITEPSFGTINSITANFSNNYVHSNAQAAGGCYC
ncbi:MAG: hypothetical protein IJZ59_05405 [Alphaproteobacteria bacterium]|nr:hypothetical protein [Alphaproteobacteria bacterium]